MGRKNRNKKPSGKVKKTVLSVLLVLLIVILIAAALLGYRYRSHIKAAVIWLTTSDEDIQKNIDIANDKQTEVLNNSGFHASKELDEALQSGKITAEEHTQILIGELTLQEALEKNDADVQTAPENTTVSDETQTDEGLQSDDTRTDNSLQTEPPNGNANDSGNSKTDGNNVTHQTTKSPKDQNQDSKKQSEASTGQTQSSSDADKRIAELVTKMYVLKADYTGAVEGVVSSMKADYVKLPPEQRTKSAKQSIAAGYMSKINAMEAQCDAQVNAIVAELRQILKENGRDMSLADAIVSTYATEKENTKAYYLSTYGD